MIRLSVWAFRQCTYCSGPLGSTWIAKFFFLSIFFYKYLVPVAWDINMLTNIYIYMYTGIEFSRRPSHYHKHFILAVCLYNISELIVELIGWYFLTAHPYTALISAFQFWHSKTRHIYWRRYIDTTHHSNMMTMMKVRKIDDNLYIILIIV